MNIFQQMWKLIFCILLQVFPYDLLVCGKLTVKKNVPERDSFEKMRNCFSSSIYRFYEGRTLVFLGDEMRDSVGEQLLITGISATVDKNDKPAGQNRRKQIFILQPKLVNTYKSEVIYNLLLKKAEKASYFLIVWPSNTTLDNVSKLHNAFWKYRILRVASFIPTMSSDLDIYTYFPYTEGNCGSGKIVQKVDKCTSEGFETNFNLFSGLVKLYNFHGCDITCFGNNQFPESVLTLRANGTWDVQGNIVYALDTFKAHYNVSLTYVNIFNDKYGWFFYNTSMQTLMQKHENSSYEFGFGAFTILNAIKNPDLDYSFASNPECIGWAVPLFAGKHPSVWKVYVNEFPLLVWIFIGLAIFTATNFIVVARRVEEKHTNLIQMVRVSLMMIFSIIAESPKVKSTLVSLKVFLFQWSLWGLIVRCAYEASLGSLMTVPIPIQDLKSNKELLEKNLQVAGGVKMYELLKMSSAKSKVLKSLVKKFKILPPSNSRKVLEDIYENRNLAVLQPNRYTVYSSGTFARLRGLNSLAVVMKPCLVKTYAAPLLIRKGSIMSELLYTFINRIFEAGLMKYWKTKDGFPKEKLPKLPVSINLDKLYGAFLIFFIGIGLAVTVFAVEMIHTKSLTKTTKNTEKTIIV